MDSKRALMVEKLNEAKNEIIRQAQLNKELKESKKKGDEKYREACIYAAHYYSDNLIDEIHNKSTAILKTNDFAPNEYKKRFSDIATIKVTDIEFLNKREDEIAEIEQQLSEPLLSDDRNKLSKWVVNLVDALHGSNCNDN